MVNPAKWGNYHGCWTEIIGGKLSPYEALGSFDLNCCEKSRQAHHWREPGTWNARREARLEGVAHCMTDPERCQAFELPQLVQGIGLGQRDTERDLVLICLLS